MKKEKWDGRSRPATDKSQIIKPKKGRGSFKRDNGIT